MDSKPTLDELQAQIDAGIEAERNDYNIVGAPSGEQKGQAMERAADESSLRLLGRGFNTMNSAVDVYQHAERAFVQTDPNFNVNDHYAELTQGIPMQYHTQFAATRSLAEAKLLRDQILSEVEDRKTLAYAGARGLVAGGLAGIVDLDAPLMLMSEGTYAGAKIGAMATKLGVEGTRAAQMLKFGAAGAEAGLVTETASAFTSPTGDWTDIPNAGLMGLVFGSTIGTFSKVDAKANAAAQNLREDFADSVANGQAGRTDYSSTVQDTGYFAKFNEDSVGAASVGNTEGKIDKSLLSEAMQAKMKESQQYIIDNGIVNQFEFAFPNTPMGQSARKFYDNVTKTILASDWDKLMQSKSPTAQVLAYMMFESPAGIVRNNKSGAVLNNIYHTEIAAPVATNYNRLFNQWSKDTSPQTHGLVAQLDDALLGRFNDELMTELQYRYHDGVSNPNVHPAIKEMADRVDEASARAIDVLKGRAGETSVFGSENLKAETGWFRQLWRGDKISKLIRERGVSRKAIEQGLQNSYRKLYPHWDAETAEMWAKAVVRRSLAKERGIDTNLVRLLDEEGVEYMREFLKDNGFNATKAEALIEGLKGQKSDQSKLNLLKNRKDVDLREQIPGTEFKLLDLVDNDVLRVWGQYSRSAAGASAMARHGIQKQNKKAILEQIKMEEEASGKRVLSDEFLDDMFTYFDGGAFAGGVNPWMRRALQLTNLSLLNGLGLTQMAEMGVQIAAVGWEAFRHTAPKEVKDMLDGKTVGALDELRPLMSHIDGEHNIHMDWMALDNMKNDPGHFSELGRWLDGLLIKGSRIQGYTSGFYKMKQLQQRIAVRSMLYRLADNFEGKAPISKERLYDLGITNETIANRIGKYFKEGTVERGPDGDVVKLNFDKWKPEDVYELAASLNRHADQVVQRAMRGESSQWMSRDLGALLAHLKSFTMVAMQKQLLRNARIMDAEATMGFIYSLMTACAVYTAQQAISGRDQNLTADRIVRGAISMSNMTGFLPQWSDPVMSMLGMDNLRFSPYNAQGVGGDVLGPPPALTTINRIAHIPGSAVKVLTGDYKNQDIYALQATPIIGNAYGLSYMFNKMKE